MEQVSNGLPKSLIPVLGVPFIDYQLRWLAEQGISRVVLSIGYQADMIIDYVGSGARWGIEIICIEDGAVPLGTAGAIRNAVDQNILDGGFFILYGDSFLQADFSDIWQTSENGTRAIMTVFKNDNAWDACNVIMENNRLALFQKNAPPEIKSSMHYIDYGLSVLDSTVITEMVPSGVAADMADLQHRLSVEGRLTAYEVYDRFYEIGSPQGLNDLEVFLTVKKKFDE
jgi:NDP-sugar pyrophosphorylase family protein